MATHPPRPKYNYNQTCNGGASSFCTANTADRCSVSNSFKMSDIRTNMSSDANALSGDSTMNSFSLRLEDQNSSLNNNISSTNDMSNASTDILPDIMISDIRDSTSMDSISTYSNNNASGYLSGSSNTSTDDASKANSDGTRRVAARTIFSMYENFDPASYGFPPKEIFSEDDIPITSSAELPPHLKEFQFDVVLIYCEKDKREAILFKEIVERFLMLEDGKSPKMCTLDRALYLSWVQGRFTHQDEAYKRSTYMFLFMSDNFVDDAWAELQKDECLQESIDNADKKWCVVPVHTVPKQDCNYTTPWGLRSLKGHFVNTMIKGKTFRDFKHIDIEKVTDRHIDAFFKKSMCRLLDSRLRMKLDRRRAQEVAKKDWYDREIRRRQLKLKKHLQDQEIAKQRAEKEDQLREAMLEKNKLAEEEKVKNLNISDINSDNQINIPDNNIPNETILLCQSFVKNGLNPAEAMVKAMQVAPLYKAFIQMGHPNEEAITHSIATLAQVPIQQSSNQLPKKAAPVYVINNPQTVTVGDHNNLTITNAETATNRNCEDTENDSTTPNITRGTNDMGYNSESDNETELKS